MILKTITISNTLSFLYNDQLNSLYELLHDKPCKLFFEDNKSEYIFELYMSGYTHQEIINKLNLK